jgi:hypothetical protein
MLDVEGGTGGFNAVVTGSVAAGMAGVADCGVQLPDSSRMDSRNGMYRDLCFTMTFVENVNRIQYITGANRVLPPRQIKNHYTVEDEILGNSPYACRRERDMMCRQSM